MNCRNRNYLFRLFVSVFILTITFVLAVPSVSASPISSYYDWGSYYNSAEKKVLGVSFPSSEKLPVPDIPQNAIPPKAKGILPGNPLYNLEIITENIQLALTFNPIQKETQRLAFASERLSEIKTLADQGKSDLANEAAVIYKKTMDTISQNIETFSSQNTPGSADLLAKVEDTAASHAVVAQSLAFSSPASTTPFWTKVVDATEKVMDTTADALNQPAIPEDLSTSIQELKEQGLITPEESDKLYRLPDRADVRDELDKLVASGQFPRAEAIKLNNAIAVKYPDTYKDTQEVVSFAELRTYQALTPPSSEILDRINEWKNQAGDVPAPGEIRPYLYYARAQELAKNIDFSRFDSEQQSEAARFYPESVVQNPTFVGTPPTPSPSPSASPIPAPSGQPSITPSPSPTTPTTESYLTDYSGPLPGTFGYFFKNIGEQAALITSFNPARRLELEMNYADERLREARILSSEKGKEKLYEQTLDKYQSLMNKASDNIKDFNGSEEEKRDLARALESESARHNAVFEKGLLPPPFSEDTKIYATAISATEDAMDSTSDVLGRPVLPQILANRLQDLKAQGIILQEEVSDLTNAKSREEVREKIRDLVKIGSFPPADAKKLDEAQSLITPSDFNQLVEVRKIEELQNLRAVQAEFAQTATLKQIKDSYEQRANTLYNTIDPSLIRIEDLAGREELIKTYKDISAKAPKRPINAGQFGPDVIPGAPLPKPPSSSDAVLGICPIGALFQQSEGCVWEDTGERINDYTQYKCDKPAQYWSFVSKACVPMDIESPGAQDGSPSCPIGYTWSWSTSNCQAFTGGGGILPSPRPEPSPTEKDIDRLTKSCPAGATYEVPKGCVWDTNDKPVYDETQYGCYTNNSYYSFTQNKCVPNPDPKKPFPDDAAPQCKEEDTFWNWSQGACVSEPEPKVYPNNQAGDLLVPKPIFVAPDSPFYFLKQGAETIQSLTAITPQAREKVKLAQARERFAEAYSLLEKNNEEGFKDALAKYTGTMQSVFNDIDKGLSLNAESKKELGEKLAAEVTEQNLFLQKVSILASKDMASPISAAVSVVIQGIDRASDLQDKTPIPENIKEKLDSLPEDMLSKEQKQKLAQADTRLEARLIAGELVSTGALTQSDLASLDNWTAPADAGSTLRLTEIKKLSEAVELTNLKEDIAEKVEKTEDVAKKLDEFKKNFAPGEDIPSDIRPYVRLTRIDEISQTIRPDVLRLGDFNNRKDLQLAVAALQQEFKPTKEDFQRLAEFRRSSPGRSLPSELARIEALSYSIGVRDSATACFLPSPPFAPNTPCPASGAAIPIASFYNGSASFPGLGGYGGLGGGYGDGRIADEFRPGWPGWPGGPPPVSVDKDGKPLVYGKGPEAAKAGVCPDGYHWMYDTGGWCMSNSGNYSSIPSYSTPYPSIPGYTPYTPYYSAPGVPPASYGYQSPGGYSNFINAYSPPNYYGTAPTSYSTVPAPGTVPGTGPAPTSPGQCPSGFHWMPPSAGQAGWCMSDAGTYVGGGYGGNASYGYTDYSATPTSGGYNCGGRAWDSVQQRCSDGACPSGFSWDGSKCAPFTSPNYSSYPSYSGGGGYNYSSPSSYQYGCAPGNYWDGSKCVAGSYEGSGWSDTAARSTSYCQPPSNGCGSNSYWDYGSCSCRTSSSYYGGPYSGSSGSSGSSCSPPSGGCGSGWFDNGSCSCKQASSQGCYNVSASSCGSGFYWDSSACTCRSSSTSSSGTSSTPTSSGSTSSGSCPSGYHWMSDSGGWCMSDGAASSGSTSTSTSTYTPPPSTSPTTSTTTAPTQTSTSTTTTSTPTTTTTTESSSPPPSSSEPVPPPPNP